MVPGPKAETHHIKLTLQAIRPETIESLKADLLPVIREALRESGQEHLLASGELKVEVEKTFPTNEIIVVGITLLSQVALKVFEEVVLPKLKKALRGRAKSRRAKSKK
jgi:hypothetical protein